MLISIKLFGTSPSLNLGFDGQIKQVVIESGSLEGLNMASDNTDLAIPEVNDMASAASSSSSTNGGPKEMKFEQRRVASATSTKITTDGYSSEEATANASHSRRLQADGLHYEESGQAAAMKARLEMDGITAEKAAAVKQVSLDSHLFYAYYSV